MAAARVESRAEGSGAPRPCLLRAAVAKSEAAASSQALCRD